MSSHELKPEKIFLFLAISFGVLFVFIYPPAQGPDENTHIYRAFQISDGQWKAERNPDNRVGGYIPINLFKLVNSFERIYNQPENKTTPCEIFSYLQTPLDNNNRIPVPFLNTALFSPISYIPQVLGILVGKNSGMSPLLVMYLGRLFGLIAWSLIVSAAIRITPIYRWVFFLLALTPMSLSQATIITADGITNALSFLFIALCLRYAFGEQVRIKVHQLCFLTLVICLLSLSKQIYLPLIFLYFLIPIQNIGSKKKYIGWFVSMFLTALFLESYWALITSQLYSPFFEGVSPKEQVNFLFSHPFQFPIIVSKTLFRHGLFYIEEFIGKLGWGWKDAPLRKEVFVVYSLGLLITSLLDHTQRIQISCKKRLLFLTLFVIGTLIICTTLYLHWSYVGADVIGGIQGRYFIPFMPLLFLVLYRSIPHLNISGKYWAVFTISIPFYALSMGLLALLSRYY